MSSADSNRGARPTLLLAGATGPTGAAVVRRLVGHPAFSAYVILALRPVREFVRAVSLHVVTGTPMATWPAVPADVGVVMFDPPRLFHQREMALWVPAPADVPALAAWLYRCGVRTLALVQPHAMAQLPAALQHGFASLDEQALAGLGFERLLLLRSPQAGQVPAPTSVLHRLSRTLFSALRHMIPAGERPVRPSTIADVTLAAVRHAPPGVHVLPSALLHAAAQGNADCVVRAHFEREGAV